MCDVRMDLSNFKTMGVVEVAYYHNEICVDTEMETGVEKDHVELIYGLATIKWFGKIAASILN